MIELSKFLVSGSFYANNIFFDIKCESVRVKKSIRSFWETWKRLNKNICLSSFLKNQSYTPGWYIWFVWHCFPFFSVIAISFDATSCLFKLKCFNWSNSFVCYPFPSLNWVLKLSLGTVSHAEIWSDAYQKIIFLGNKTIALSLLTLSDFAFVLAHYIATYETHSFLLPYLSFHVFSANN